MKVFLDTNILIDFIARREDFYQAAANLINLGIKGEVKLYTTPLTYATCIFIARKVLGYDGIVYRSKYAREADYKTKSGINFTIFNYDKCKAVSSKIYQANRISIQINDYSL